MMPTASLLGYANCLYDVLKHNLDRLGGQSIVLRLMPTEAIRELRIKFLASFHGDLYSFVDLD